jgi:hypothetical protein
MELSWGYDPEQHLFDNEVGKIVSSILVLRQDKLDKIELGDGFSMYSDNMLTECASPPCRSTSDATCQLRTVFLRMQERLGSRYELVPQASHVYTQDQLVKVENPNVTNPETGKPHVMDPFAFGCDPNFDAYTERERKVKSPSDGLRTGSFHIHIGDRNIGNDPLSPLHGMRNKTNAIKMMDIFVGCASIIMDKDPTSPTRRQLYGRAGEFRPTDYGIEYRVLGNWFLRSPETVQTILDVAEHAMSVVWSGHAMDYLSTIHPLIVQHAINSNKPDVARMVLRKASIPSRLLYLVEKD